MQDVLKDGGTCAAVMHVRQTPVYNGKQWENNALEWKNEWCLNGPLEWLKKLALGRK